MRTAIENAILAALFGLALVLVAFAARAETGLASYYSGGRTACGGVVGPFTAAHRTFPCGARVRVTNRHGQSIVATITDRGPFVRGRIIDLGPGAARALNMIGPGIIPVTVERIQ